MKREDIAGVYRQLGFEVLDAGGKVIDSDYNCASQIMYSPDGYVGVISAPAARPKVSGSDHRTDLNGATVEERAQAASNLTCYAGRYELTDGAVHHHIEVALNPNLIGQTLDPDPARAHRRPEPDAVVGAGRAGAGAAHHVAAGGKEVGLASELNHSSRPP
jgi:hypothetical protein